MSRDTFNKTRPILAQMDKKEGLKLGKRGGGKGRRQEDVSSGLGVETPTPALPGVSTGFGGMLSLAQALP